MSERRRKRDALRRIFQKEDRSTHVAPEPSTDTASLETSQSAAGSSLAQVAQVQGPSSPDDELKPPQAGVAKEQASAKLPEASVVNSSTTRTASRWEEAYIRFKSRNPDLATSFEDEWTAPSGEDGPTPLEFKPSNFGAMIESKEAQRSAKQLVINCGSKSVKVREQSEKVIKFIIASKDYVSLALTAQPYASLAWSGVCLILPLAVNSSEQNAAMSGGIAKITDLLQLYRLRETLYLDDKAFSKSSSPHIVDYEQSIVNLYSQILEFQAEVIHHLSLNRLRRGLRGTFVTCPWEVWLQKIDEKDGHCQRFSTLVDRKKEDDYRLKISSRDDAFQRTLVDAVINLGGTKQDAREEKDVELLQVLSSSYREGKDINPIRISGTCQWLFEDSEAFKSFRDVDKSSVFWLSAGPGCGKSVLSKALIDDGYLIPTGHAMTTQVCYFFYKDGQKGRMQAVDAVRAILHQILLNNASSQLFQEVRQQLRGFKESDMTFDLLWDALIQLVGHPEAGRIICVIDALDECESSEAQKLMDALIDFFNDAEQSDSGISLKFFITSRPYDNIEYKFRALQGHSTYLSMDGNANSDAIAGDIDRVIDFEVEREFSRLSSSDRDKLREAFKSKSSRTYLWLMLTMNLIRNHRSKYSRLQNIEELLESIPAALSDAYSKLLE